jgi:hypothetical protein
MLSSCLLCLVHLWSCNFISSCCGTALKHDTKWKWNHHLASQNCHTKISINTHHVNLPESRLIWNIQHCLCSTIYGQSFAYFFTCKTISPALPLSKFQLQQIIMDSPPLISQISRETMVMFCYFHNFPGQLRGFPWVFHIDLFLWASNLSNKNQRPAHHLLHRLSSKGCLATGSPGAVGKSLIRIQYISLIPS